jgi:hypothetical protein
MQVRSSHISLPLLRSSHPIELVLNPIYLTPSYRPLYTDTQSGLILDGRKRHRLGRGDIRLRIGIQLVDC